MIGYSLKTGPTSEPITVQDLKEHTKVWHDLEDGLVLAYLRAAVAEVERKTGLCLMEQTWIYTCDVIPEDCIIWMERSPLKQVVTVKYLDINGAEQTLDSSKYQVDTNTKPGRIFIRDVPVLYSNAINRVTIEFKSGFESGKIPEDLLNAVRMMAAAKYIGRSDSENRYLTAADKLCRLHEKRVNPIV